MLSKEQLISNLEKAIGNTAYGKEIIAEANETYGDELKNMDSH
jgi:hypothetical protein